MAYGDDIDALNPDHRYQLSSNANDSVGTVNGTNSGGVFTGSPICEDATNSYVTNLSTDRITLPVSTDIEDVLSQKAVCGWFMATSIQTPPRRIYGEGDTNPCFQFIIAYGNNTLFEVIDTNFNLQIFGPVFEPDRAYHLCGIFEGNGSANEARFYIDGVEQTLAEPTDRQPDASDLDDRATGGIFGDPTLTTIGIGDQIVNLTACVNGHYNQWGFFSGLDAALTETEIREELFEKGALPDVTITTGTEAAMQTQINSINNSTRSNAPLAIRVNANTGDTDFELDLTNVVFDDRISIHIQYMGTAKLSIRNSGTSNASIGSIPSGGEIEFIKPIIVTIIVKDVDDNSNIDGAFVRIVDSADKLISQGNSNVAGLYSFTYDYITDEDITGIVRKGSSSTYYKQSSFSGTFTENNFSITILMVKDE